MFDDFTPYRIKGQYRLTDQAIKYDYAHRPYEEKMAKGMRERAANEKQEKGC